MTCCRERFLKILASLFFLVWFTGCATVIKGTDESISVLTDPSGAVCDLDRDGTTIGVVNPTPGTLEVDRDKDDILVTCRLDGYEDSTAILSSEFTGFTIGNVILGGLIGVGVDAASGANNEYPDNVSIVMIPKQFSSEQQRDDVYDKLARQAEERAAALTDEIRRRCAPDNERECNKKVKAVEDARDQELASIEAKRQRARIVPP